MSVGESIFSFSDSGDAASSTLRVDAARRSGSVISPYLTGKFCEHLGSNIYNGMEAQILRNPTFADFPFGGGGTPPDGGARFQSDEEKIRQAVRSGAGRFEWPDEAADRLIESREDALAHWWIREGARDEVRVSPDAYRSGARAQRVEVNGPGLGVAQLAHLPLHRVRSYEWRVLARSFDLSSLTISLGPEGGGGKGASAEVKGLSREWKTFTGKLDLPEGLPAESLYRLSLTAPGSGQFVVARVLLYPADHVGGADPDVIRFLAESRLPILRWPGGNFVSGYHWEDGVGPVDERPVRPNPAWSGLEYNLFGTHEFVAFCRAVGCEPMICLNCGNGTPEEAARWIEYCNGPADSPEGQRRAANGHPEPFGIAYWEIGNEITGRHQIGWTTPAGYTDRYREFAEAMLAADPGVKLLACGAPVWWGEDWNDRLIETQEPPVRCITDHILVGGRIDPSSDPLEIYRDFMTFPDLYEEAYLKLRDQMMKAGHAEPKLAITELQLFGRVGEAAEGNEGAEARLTRETLVSPATMAEAVYDLLICHLSVRLAPFVEMITQSATVNHGGGLRKQRERVYANPCHYAQALFADLGGATPVAVELTSPVEKPAGIVPDLARAGGPGKSMRVIDAVAAVSPEGGLLVSVIHRGVGGPVELTIEIEGFEAGGEAEVAMLAAEKPWMANTLEEPEAVVPVDSRAPVRDGTATVTVPPYSVSRVRIPTG